MTEPTKPIVLLERKYFKNNGMVRTKYSEKQSLTGRVVSAMMDEQLSLNYIEGFLGEISQAASSTDIPKIANNYVELIFDDRNEV